MNGQCRRSSGFVDLPPHGALGSGSFTIDLGLDAVREGGVRGLGASTRLAIHGGVDRSCAIVVVSGVSGAVVALVGKSRLGRTASVAMGGLVSSSSRGQEVAAGEGRDPVGVRSQSGGTTIAREGVGGSETIGVTILMGGPVGVGRNTATRR
ncbi:hypothetical protein PG995_014629 [Apiospora arundinis]